MVPLELEVPHQWELPLGGSHEVVSEQELEGLADAVPAELLGDPVYGLVVWL